MLPTYQLIDVQMNVYAIWGALGYYLPFVLQAHKNRED